MSEGNLRACPFCGRLDDRQNAVQESSVALTSFKGPMGRALRVECTCGAKGSSSLKAEEAIAAWNTRADDWQDIATAPRDGTRFDVWVPDGDGYRVTDLRATSQGSLIDKRGCLADLPCWPTHWRPLPAAPQVSAGGVGRG